MLHGNERRAQRGKLCVGQISVDGVLVKLAELPVDGEDVHVVVLLEVVGKQVQGVITGLKPLLVLVDLLHPELLLLGQQVVVLVALVQRHQNVLQPVPHTQWELCQLAVQTGLDEFAGADVVEVQLVALLGSLQGALGGKEVAGGLVGLVVSAANMLKVSFHRWAGRGVLAHTHGSVALIHLTHFALLAVVVQTGILSDNILNNVDGLVKLSDLKNIC